MACGLTEDMDMTWRLDQTVAWGCLGHSKSIILSRSREA